MAQGREANRAALQEINFSFKLIFFPCSSRLFSCNSLHCFPCSAPLIPNS